VMIGDTMLHGRLFVRRDDDAVVFLTDTVWDALQSSTKHVDQLPTMGIA
jgi:hypothetical protein